MGLNAVLMFTSRPLINGLRLCRSKLWILIFFLKIVSRLRRYKHIQIRFQVTEPLTLGLDMFVGVDSYVLARYTHQGFVIKPRAFCTYELVVRGKGCLQKTLCNLISFVLYSRKKGLLHRIDHRVQEFLQERISSQKGSKFGVTVSRFNRVLDIE